MSFYTQNYTTVQFEYGLSRVEVPDLFPDFEGRAASGFRPNFQNRAESLSMERLDTRFGSLDVSHANGPAASGFRPKLHSRADSLSLESLDIRSGKPGHESCAVGRESLDIPKPGRESLDMGRESLDTEFRDQC